jgi:hypothetical protein
MILSVLNGLREGNQVLFDTKSNGILLKPFYPNIIVAFDVQLSWFMKFAMEIFIPYPLASNPIWHNIQLKAITMYEPNTKCH